MVHMFEENFVTLTSEERQVSIAITTRPPAPHALTRFLASL
jgi:hypothetical protein